MSARRSFLKLAGVMMGSVTVLSRLKLPKTKPTTPTYEILNTHFSKMIDLGVTHPEWRSIGPRHAGQQILETEGWALVCRYGGNYHFVRSV